MGVLNKKIIPLALVGYEMIMAKKAPKRQLGATHLVALYHLISNAHSWKTVNFLHSGHCSVLTGDSPQWREFISVKRL